MNADKLVSNQLEALPKLSVTSAINLLIQAVDKAQQAGVYTLKDAALLYQVMLILHGLEFLPVNNKQVEVRKLETVNVDTVKKV